MQKLFYYDRGLKLLRGLAIDVRHRQPRAFISHAHADHMARHALALCTPETAMLYQFRLGKRRTLEMPYRQTIAWGGMRLTAYPAGHCLGSAMLLVEDGDTRLLYTGDFKLGPSATAVPAELPQADVLIIESTFGNPAYRLLPREEAIAQLISEVRRVLADGKTPVIHAYVLGKAQEVTRLLTLAGIPVLQHPAVFEISQIYTRCGVQLGNHRLYPGEAVPGHAVIVPPRGMRGYRLPRLGPVETFAVTGWAKQASACRRYGVDHAIALSDHADFDDLLTAATQVNPRQIYCTHGPPGFEQHLRAAGFDAERLE